MGITIISCSMSSFWLIINLRQKVTFYCVPLALVSWRKNDTNQSFFVYGTSFLVNLFSFYSFLVLDARGQVQMRCIGSPRCV